ncbi:uncharacterized protein LOC142333186 [Lycorma delicatula]|uniref:uncharacterized protein LOC142333186 n=1 Tax=Lycorma delicatula TaxID=130591 RepID=UPI003F51A6C2
MDARFCDSFGSKDPLHIAIKQEIKYDDTEETECFFMPVNKSEENLASDCKIDAEFFYRFMDENPLQTDIKHETEFDEEKKIDEFVFVSVNKSEEALTSDINTYKSFYKAPPEKEDPLHMGSCNISLNTTGMKIASVKLEDVNLKEVDIGVETFADSIMENQEDRFQTTKIMNCNKCKENGTCNHFDKQKCVVCNQTNIYTDKRNYKCNFCEKSFKQNAYLKKHLDIHFSKKRFTCNVCQKSFHQNG